MLFGNIEGAKWSGSGLAYFTLERRSVRAGGLPES